MQTDSQLPSAPPGSAPPGGSARRGKTRNVLTVVQIVLFPICIAIAPGPMTKWCFTIATMMFMARLWIETLEAPNNALCDGSERPQTLKSKQT
jgi:hypothetical protein